MTTEHVLASPVVSAFMLVGLRYVYTIYYFKSKRGFDSSADLAGGCRRDARVNDGTEMENSGR